MSTAKCPACDAMVTAAQWPTMLCERCYSKGIVWAAKQALAAERAANAYGGNLTLTIDPAACYPPATLCGMPISWVEQLDTARGLGITPGPTPNVLGSNVEQAVENINDEVPVTDPFYVKQREDWRNQP
jgi:hypothetical protein